MATVMGGDRERSDDREALIQFLGDTHTFLGAFLEIRQVTLPQYLHDTAIAAWPDVEAALRDAVAVLRGEEERLRRPYPRGIEPSREDLDQQLEFFGLTGEQLRLKLTSFRTTFRQLFERPSFVQVMAAPPNAYPIPVRRKKSKLVEWLFPKINSILGSLSKVIPGVDIIKEFKEMAEAGYKESQETLG